MFIPGMTGGVEMLIFLAVLLLLFGHRLPTVMRSMGQGITEFKKGLRDDSPPKDTPKLPQDPNSG
jgi:sec-independent protein translocase protein TatA